MAALQKGATFDKKVSIVIPTYNRPGLAEKLARQILSFHGDKFEIHIIKSTGNTSLAKNQGIKKATGDIIIFFDDDVEITKDTIPSHIKVYENPNVVGVAGRVINDGEVVPKKTGVETGKTDFLGSKFVYRFWSTKKQSVDFVYGCNMSFRKIALKKIGGFDEKFPKIFEEVDLSKRIQKFGNILFEPKAFVYHHKATAGGIRPEEAANKQKLIFRNYGYYLAKNILFPISFISLLLRVRTALKFSPRIVLHLIRGYLQSLIVNYPLLLILPLIAFLRLWKVPDFFLFTFSEEWQGTLAWEQVKNFHPIWIGVSQANTNFYLGPGFIYLNYLLFLLKNGDPAVLAYFSVLLGLATVICLYYLTSDLFSRRVALISSLIYGCSTLINYYDRRFWNPSFLPLFSLLFVYSLVKAGKDSRWLILTSVLIGASFHFHLLLLLFMLPTFYVVIKNFKEIKLPTWLLMIILFLIAVSPLIVFDLNHNFDNLLAPYRIIFEKKQTGLYAVSGANIISHIKTMSLALGRIWFLKLNTNLQDVVLETNTYKIPGNIFLSLLSIIALAWFFLKNRKKGFPIFFISILSILLAFLVYPSYNPEYYLMGFLTLMAIVLGFWLNTLPKIASYAILTIFVLVNILTVITTTGDYGLLMKKRLIQKTVDVIKNRSFSLETAGPLPNPQYAYAGWRLLFKLYGKTPGRSSVDSVLGWIYPDEIAKEEPELHLIVSEGPMNLDQKPIAVIREGVYYSYIINN